jgi:hypothetical protein
MMPGMPERHTHDYVRGGVTTLFAALNTATGEVIGQIHRRHRVVEFKKFLIRIDKEVPDGLDVHLTCDNASTHKAAAIQRWLTARPRFHVQVRRPRCAVPVSGWAGRIRWPRSSLAGRTAVAACEDIAVLRWPNVLPGAEQRGFSGW